MSVAEDHNTTVAKLTLTGVSSGVTPTTTGPVHSGTAYTPKKAQGKAAPHHETYELEKENRFRTNGWSLRSRHRRLRPRSRRQHQYRLPPRRDSIDNTSH